MLNLDIGADSKALQNVIKEVQKIAPELAFMGISEDDAGISKPGSAMGQVPQCNNVGAVIAWAESFVNGAVTVIWLCQLNHRC